MCLGQATAHAQMPGQPVSESRDIGAAVSRQRAGTAFCVK